MTLREAIATIGQHPAARLTGVKRTTIQRWHDNDRAPAWRLGEVRMIMRAAKLASAKADQRASA